MSTPQDNDTSTARFVGHTKWQVTWRTLSLVERSRIGAREEDCGRLVAVPLTKPDHPDFELRGLCSEVDARMLAYAPKLLADRDALRAQVAQLREALEQIASYPIATVYPDGPCVVRSDMEIIRAALAATAPKE